MSDLEETFDGYCRIYGIPQGQKEYFFHPTRKWRFDRAWPEQQVACEIEGGIFIRGRHSRGRGYGKDVDKYNQATAMGWRVYRATTIQINEQTDEFFNLLKDQF